MICPHGKELTEESIYGLTVFSHRTGGGCDLLNRFDVSGEELAAASIKRAIESGMRSQHMLRTAYSSYKISTDVRFLYLEYACKLTAGSEFLSVFEPVRLALASEDDSAANGLYLMELYFCFCGITQRLTAANAELPGTRLYQLLGSLDIVRFMPRENELTRRYAKRLHSRYRRYQNAIKLPEWEHPR